MESVICRVLMGGGLLAGVLLAGGQGEQALGPVVLGVLTAMVLRRMRPLFPRRA